MLDWGVQSKDRMDSPVKLGNDSVESVTWDRYDVLPERPGLKEESMKFVRFALIATTFLLQSASADARLLSIGPSYDSPAGLSERIAQLEALTTNDPYQVGEEWGKVAISMDSLRGKSEAFKRAALATASFGGGTSFYLGKIGDAHIMATNHHVISSEWACNVGSARFTLLELRFGCEKLLGTWTDIDLALFVINVDPASEAKLSNVGRNFAFNRSIQRRQALMTIGYGSHFNRRGHIVATDDRDCRVFSGDDEFRHMADPDTYNPGPYSTWSFSVGCDVSHGDSGSAMVDRRTGDVVGLIWTGKIPKSSVIQSSDYLDGLLREPTEAVWTELNYAVPAPKIKEFLQRELDEGRIVDREKRELLSKILRGN